MKYAPLVLVLPLSACASLQAAFAPQNPDADAIAAAAAAAAPPQEIVTLDPTPPPPPPASATTAAEFDTTTDEDRQAALAPVEAAGETRLGPTLVTLGNPANPGIWLETGYVNEVTAGRVETASGQSINIELRPSGGEPGSGSEISLPAMQLLGLSLTAIVELTVYRL
jgi:hypothetical protein